MHFPPKPFRRAATPVATLLSAVLVTACASDAVTRDADAVATRAGSAAQVAICHTRSDQPQILSVAAPALAAHLRHGDYVSTLEVRRDAVPVIDGVHFRRITDALAAARTVRLSRGEHETSACRITIQVAAGRYAATAGSPVGDIEQLPLIVDVPDITLRGATRPVLNTAGRPTGVAVEGVETVIAPSAALPVVAGASTPIVIANGHPGGSAGHRLEVEGFVLTTAPNTPSTGGGQGVLGVRVEDLDIHGNRFEPGFTESIDLRASTGIVRENHLTGTAGSCDVCLAAPGRYSAVRNTLLTGGIPGITTSAFVGLPLPAAVEPLVVPATAEVWSDVRQNEVRDHLRTPVGVALRVETVGNLAPNVVNTVHAELRENLLVNNRFGIIVHAGFPVSNTTLQGHADVTLGDNIIQQSCQTKLLVTFSRHQRTLGLNTVLPYLQNSTYTLTLNGNLPWSEVWYDLPAGRNNTLTVDGVGIAPAKRQFYSASTCPAAQ